MSAEKKRGPVTYAAIVVEVEEARGRAIMSSLSTAQGRGLPIRDPESGAVLVYVPEVLSEGLRPIAINGYVVGYYRDDLVSGETLYPFVSSHEVIGLAAAPLGERWVSVFDGDRGAIGHMRVT